MADIYCFIHLYLFARSLCMLLENDWRLWGCIFAKVVCLFGADLRANLNR